MSAWTYEISRISVYNSWSLVLKDDEGNVILRSMAKFDKKQSAHKLIDSIKRSLSDPNIPTINLIAP